jgi:purine-binding chemotaxis protein CheW
MQVSAESMNNMSGALVGSLDESLITFRVNQQLFGIPVHLVQDVLRQFRVTPIPLSPPHVAGSMNLRGRTVTVIDLRNSLHMPACDSDQEHMNIVVEHRDELFSFQVDKVGDVLSLPKDKFETAPPNLDRHWQEMSHGVYTLESELLVVLNIYSILDFKN